MPECRLPYLPSHNSDISPKYQRATITSFGNPFACAAIMVMSPGFGLVLLRGVYCLTASCRTSSCFVDVERGKPRICDASILCSSIRKCFEDMFADCRRYRAEPVHLMQRRILSRRTIGRFGRRVYAGQDVSRAQ